MVFYNYGYIAVNASYDIVRRCKGFYNIVTAQPSLFLPEQVAGIFVYWEDGENKDLSLASFQMPSKGDAEPKFNVFDTIKMDFDIKDEGDVILTSIPSPTLLGFC